MKYIAQFIFWIWGWKIMGEIPNDVKKCIVVMAPHTSMWDFVLGRLGWYILGRKVKFLIKKEMFFFPLGPIVKWLGGIPVDRSKSGKLVESVAAQIRQNDSFYIVITPEGTRRLNPNWKRGFYYIAQQARVPVALGYLDYEKKTGGVGPIFTPSGDYHKDFKLLEDFYRGKGARHPEKFNLS
jgi:1-acyl-sn-glycerol-3-phosphate acyltransferase